MSRQNGNMENVCCIEGQFNINCFQRNNIIWFCVHLKSRWTCIAIVCIASERCHPSLFQIKMKNIFFVVLSHANGWRMVECCSAPLHSLVAWLHTKQQPFCSASVRFCHCRSATGHSGPGASLCRFEDNSCRRWQAVVSRMERCQLFILPQTHTHSPRVSS